MLQEEPLQPLALEPLTEEEQVGLGRSLAGQGAGSSSCREGPKLERQVVEVVVLGGVGGGRRVPGSSLPPLAPSSEKLLPVSEQCGCAEADGEGGRPPPRWRLPRQGQHSEPR